MIEFLIILLIGLVAGVFVGLLPGLPAYIGPLILYPFVSHLSIDQILAIWLATHIGSQYFGSVAAILLKIPGEASSLIYIKDIDKLNTNERINLVRQTAWGSTIGSITSLLVIGVIYYLGLETELIQLSSTSVKLTLLTLLMITMCWFTDHKKTSFLLFFIGFFFSHKTIEDIPLWMHQMQRDYTFNITLFLLILAFLIIPEFINEIQKERKGDALSIKSFIKEKLDFKSIFKGTWLGSLVGLVPGPSHILAAVVSYNSYNKKETKKKIISAESANNSAMITSLLPFLYIGIPITLSEFLLNDLLQVKLFLIPMAFTQPWPLFTHINFIEFSFLMIAIISLVYHFLAQRFLSYYETFLNLMYGKLKFLFLLLIGYLIYIDVTFSLVYILPYLMLLLILSYVGWVLYKRNVNVLPLIFGFLLGDLLTWTSYQFYQIYLS